MANNDNPQGLVAVGHQFNGGLVGKGKPYYIGTGDATALFKGDPVIVTGTANTSQIREYVPGTLPVITRATAGATNAITGVISGFDLPRPGEGPFGAVHRPASTEMIVYVLDDPYVIYEIQADSANAVAETDIRTNANIVYTHSGNTTSGQSGAELNTASMTADATYQLTILRMVPRVNNEMGTNVKLEVRVNLSTEALRIAGI
jgi:hypothetical protein